VRQQRLLLYPFNGLFSRTTWASRYHYQKGKTSLNLNAARDDGVCGCSGISWTICKQSAPRSRQKTTPTPHHSVFFTGRMLFLTPNQQCQSTEGSEMTTRCAYISNANILLTSAVGTDLCFFTVKSLHSRICYFSNASLAMLTSYYCNNNNNKNSSDNTSNGNNLFETVHCGSPQK